MMRDLTHLPDRVRRVVSPEVIALYGWAGDGRCGAFTVTKATREGPLNFMVVASCDDEWEHISVSLRNRCPSWDEMAWIASLFFGDDEELVQFRPAKSDYVNLHPNCLHWWKPVKATMPMPGKERVG